MKYVFDTDVISALLRAKSLTPLQQRIARLPLRSQLTTSITLGELSHGTSRAGRADLYARIRHTLSDFEVLAFDSEAAEVYGPLRASLERRGTRVDEADLRIASICLSQGHTLVSGNVKHFSKVEGLLLENWL